MAGIVERFRTGIKAFKEAYTSAGLPEGSEFTSADARRLRYALHWAFFENTAYRDIHSWAVKYRADYGLYKHIRQIYNPSYRLGEFWATHLMGGALDIEAGDGTKTPSALPITLGQGVKARQGKALRSSIARLWRDSNWQTNKTIWTRQGSMLGDAALRVVDDVERGKVYLEVFHPSLITSLKADPFGNCKGYTIEEQRRDPLGSGRMVTYCETAERDGELVIYRTFKNGEPYAWNGVAAEWSEPYGFVPLVIVQHLNVGLDWGWSELHAGVGKFREVDDLASKTHDQIRKLVDSPWLMAGVSNPKKDVAVAPVKGAAENPAQRRAEPERERVTIIYANDPHARAQPLVAPLPIGEVGSEIARLISEIERDYPELQMDIWTASGDASGRALRVARQRSEAKVRERRPAYDAGLVKAQQMAVAIGGWRGYEGYTGFDLDSYAAGALEHRIGDRPVFNADPLDELEQQGEFWTNAQAATAAGAPLDFYAEYAGMSDELLERLRRALAERAARAPQITAPPATSTTNPQPQGDDTGTPSTQPTSDEQQLDEQNPRA